MTRIHRSCLAGALALAALFPAAQRAAAEMSPDLRQRLEAVEAEEKQEHYAIAYVRLKEVERLAKKANDKAALERIGELEPFLGSSSRREVGTALDRWLHEQAATTPAIKEAVLEGSTGEGAPRPDCSYDEATHAFTCSLAIASSTWSCSVTTGAPSCKPSRD